MIFLAFGKKKKEEKNKDKTEEKEKSSKEKESTKQEIKEDERGLTKEQRKQLKKQQKEERKRLKRINQSGSYCVPSVGYTFTPSFFKSGSRYGTIIRVVNKFGQNRNLPFGWMAELIPEITQYGVRAYLIETDKPSSRYVQDAILHKINKDIARENHEGEVQTENDEDLNECALHDLQKASQLLNRDQLVIDWKLRILLVSDDPDKIVYQLKQLQETQYNSDRLRGIRLVGQGGDQRENLSHLWSPPVEEDKNEQTTVSSIYGGNDHFVRKGLSDKNGVPIGTLVESYSSGEALMDFDGSFSFDNPSHRGKILIACPESSGNCIIDMGMNRYSGASLWGQAIANHVVLNGSSRVFHIVLNHFHYGFDDDDFLASPSIEEIIRRYDMSKGGINPLEIYTSHGNLNSAFNASISKIAKEFDLLSGDELTREEKLLLEQLLIEFFISRRLWDRKADENEFLAKAVNPKNHDNYPTFGSFVNELANMVNANKNDVLSTEKDRDSAKMLKKLLEKSIDSHRAIFNKTTSIDIPKVRSYRQSYFDLSELSGEQNVMEAQFLNVFDFVSYFARKNDVIMIHGLDRISYDTLSYLQHSIKSLERERVRFAFLFDTVGANAQLAKTQPNRKTMCDMFTIENLIYQKIEDEFDFTILGQMNDKELKDYEELLGAKLPDQITRNLTGAGPYGYQIRRPSDATSNFVKARFLI